MILTRTSIAFLVLSMLLAGCGDEDGTPFLELPVTSIEFGEEYDTASFKIVNTGGGTLHWQIEDIPDWLSVEPN